MKTQDKSSKNYALIESIKQELKIPNYVFDQLISVLKSHKQVKRKYYQSNRMNEFKDEMFQKVVSMFQQKESKTIKKLKTLQEINLKYIKKYLEVKKSQSSVNLSSQLQRGDKNDEKKVDKQMDQSRRSLQSQNRIIRDDIKQITASIQSSQSKSIFQSKQWQQLIRNAEVRISEIQQQNKPESSDLKQSRRLITSFNACLNKLLLVKDSSGKMNNKLVRQIQKLIEAKKEQISENKDLRMHLQLNNDLKRLKDLLLRSLGFQNSIKQFDKMIKQGVNSSNLFATIFQLITEKVEIQNLLLAEINSNEKIYAIEGNKSLDKQKENIIQCQSQNDIFNKLCQQLFLSPQTDEDEGIKKKIIRMLSQKKQNIQQSLSNKVKSLSDYLSKVQQESKKDKQLVKKLQFQNEKIRKQMKQLQNLREKYLYHLESKGVSQFNDFSDERSELNDSKLSTTRQRIEKLIARQGEQQQKKMFNAIIAEKDELLRVQKQKNMRLSQNMVKIQDKMKSYLKKQGIQVSLTVQKQQSQLQHVFDLYSQSLLTKSHQQDQINNNQSKTLEYQQKNNQEMIIKLIEDKYSKALQLQRQQFQQRMQQLKSQLRHTQLQRDSYKNSLSQQQKQLTKSKQINQRLINKKNELQMQSCKTQQMLKSILQLLFGYLMSNISYQSLVQQLQHTIENIKHCLKYRQREKDKQSKQQPIIDYRFSGLSAVSNDYSFSKLNKESYCDYFNQDSSIEEQSEVLSKISEEDQIPPSRPSFNQKRTLIDINQRATMAHQDQSLLGYLNPVQVRTPRAQYQRTNVLFQGLNDENIRTLQSNLGYLRNRIPQQTIQVEKQIDPDTKEMYIKYKQALISLQESQRINKENQIRYQQFLIQLKQQGVVDSNQSIERRIYYMQRTIEQQQKMLQQQKVQYETTITEHVIQSEKAMQAMLKNMNKSIMSQSNRRINK